MGKKEELLNIKYFNNLFFRWVTSNKENCFIPTCDGEQFTLSNSITMTELNELGLCNAVANVPSPLPLCKHHYYLAKNKQVKTQTHCPTCNVSLRTSKTRMCPDSEAINTYLNEKTGFVGKLSDSTKVCLACYKSHLEILKANRTSTNADLTRLLTSLKETCQKSTSLSHMQDVMDVAMQHTSIYVGECLLTGESLLLPNIHTFFTRNLQHHTYMAVKTSTSHLDGF